MTDLQDRLLGHTDVHDLADLPDLEAHGHAHGPLSPAVGAGHGHAHAHGNSHGHSHGHSHGGAHDGDNGAHATEPTKGWKRRKDLDGDMGASGRLHAAAQKSSRKFAFMLVLSASYLLAEIVVGVMSGSLAVLADAFHMITDVAALVCGYWVAQLSLRKATSSMSFGWKRAEVVGALCNGCFLIAACFTIVLEAVEKLTGLRPVDGGDLVAHADKIIVLGCVGLAINLGGLCIFGGHGHSHGGGGHSHGGGHAHGVHRDDFGQDDGHHGHSHGGGGHSHGGVACGGHGDHGGDVESDGGGHGHAHAHGGHSNRLAHAGTGKTKKRQNLNELSMYLHVLGDAIGSAFVVGNACILKYGEQWGDRRLLADPIASLIMCFIILIQAMWTYTYTRMHTIASLIVCFIILVQAM